MTALYAFEELSRSGHAVLWMIEKKKERKQEEPGISQSTKKCQVRRLPSHRIASHRKPPKTRSQKQNPKSHQMFNLIHVQLDMGVHLQILVMSRVDLVLDVLFEVGHLDRTRSRLADALKDETKIKIL